MSHSTVHISSPGVGSGTHSLSEVTARDSATTDPFEALFAELLSRICSCRKAPQSFFCKPNFMHFHGTTSLL